MFYCLQNTYLLYPHGYIKLTHIYTYDIMILKGGAIMKTDAQKRASTKYRASKDTLYLELAKGSRDAWKAHAATQGKSLTAYITELVEADIAKSKP